MVRLGCVLCGPVEPHAINYYRQHSACHTRLNIIHSRKVLILFMRTLLLSTLLGGLLTAATAPDAYAQPTGLLTRTVRLGQDAYSFQVHVPAKFQGREKLPVILFLHGIGQRGEGGFVPVEGTAGVVARNYLEQVPAVVVLPQCRQNRYWNDPDMERMVIAAVEQTMAEFSADSRRLYLAGVSMGGYGAWHMAAEHAGKFAAVVPICGGSPLRERDRFTPIARRIGRTPVWVFHGADDGIVPVSESRRMVEALKAVAGSRVRYNEYPGVGHNVWFKALAEPELMTWLFAQRLD